MGNCTEIDHNFSRAHRIVTTSILPVVEKYRENSENVWEASKVRVDTSVHLSRGKSDIRWLLTLILCLVLETIL